MSKSIEGLKHLNNQLRSLLDDPHPGLITWRESLRGVLEKMSDYAGHGRVSEFSHIVNALQQCRDAIQGYKDTNRLAEDSVLGSALTEAKLSLAKALEIK
jgi:hypothetical protein